MAVSRGKPNRGEPNRGKIPDKAPVKKAKTNIFGEVIKVKRCWSSESGSSLWIESRQGMQARFDFVNDDIFDELVKAVAKMQRLRGQESDEDDDEEDSDDE